MISYLFYEITNHICLPVILVQTRKQFPITHKLLGIKKYKFLLNSLCIPLGSWGWSAHSKMCSDPPPLDFSLYVKNKLSKCIYPIEKFHKGVNTTVCTSHQLKFHGKEVRDKNMLRIGEGVHDLTHSPVDW